MDTYGEYQWKYFKFISQEAPYQYFKEIFQLTVRKIFHLWSKETGLFNVWAFSGEIFNFEEDSDLLPDGDDDDDDDDWSWCTLYANSEENIEDIRHFQLILTQLSPPSSTAKYDDWNNCKIIPLSIIANTITTQGSFDIKRLLSKMKKKHFIIWKELKSITFPLMEGSLLFLSHTSNTI